MQWTYMITIAILIIVPVIAFVLWIFFGRDPKREKTLRSMPPTDLNPAEAGYIVDGNIDVHDMASLIIYFAQRGYLDIVENEDHKFHLERKVQELPEESMSAILFFNALFGDGAQCYLEKIPGNFFNEYTKAKESMRSKFRGRLALFNGTSMAMRAFSICLAAAMAGGMVVFVDMYFTGGGLNWLWIAAGALVAAVVLAGNITVAGTIKRKFTKGVKNYILDIIIGTFIIALGLAGGFFIVMHLSEYMIWGIIYACSAGLTCLFAQLTRARTPQGVQWLSAMAALEVFIKRNDTSRLQGLQGNDPGYFYQVLPYAYAMDKGEKWTRNFKTINVQRPEWLLLENPETYDIWVVNGMLHTWTDAIRQRVTRMQ